ncbi:MAG: hypothetical protein JO360_12965 [Acidobacteria bacterium]|nr:hypothetical protein [Acidobacteriota bacterium]
MKRRRTLLYYAVALLLLLLPAGSASAQQPGVADQPAAILEFSYTNCQADCATETTRIYGDGRFLSEATFFEKAKSGRIRKILVKAEKQLEPAEMSEIVGWAEQSDFQSAQPEYPVGIVTDYQDWIILTYRSRGQEKRVKVNNYSRGSTTQKSRVPLSVIKLARWAQPRFFS